METKKNVVSFSLYGDNPRYTVGAISNIGLVRDFYPGWVCRFYINNTVPLDIVNQIRLLGAEIVHMDEDSSKGTYGSFWRFFVANDQTVDKFMCRDADSRINYREQAAVCEWLKSGKKFHLMHDSIAHTSKVMAGMWGGTAGFLPDIYPEMIKWKEAKYYDDEHFLDDFVLPLIQNDCLFHNSNSSETIFPFHRGPFDFYVGGVVLATGEFADRLWRKDVPSILIRTTISDEESFPVFVCSMMNQTFRDFCVVICFPEHIGGIELFRNSIEDSRFSVVRLPLPTDGGPINGRALLEVPPKEYERDWLMKLTQDFTVKQGA